MSAAPSRQFSHPAHPARTDSVRRILEERASALARPLEAGAGPATAQVLVLAVGASRIAVSADRAREVLPPGAMAKVPGGGFLVGVRNVRGEIIAVADAARILGLEPQMAIADRWVVLLAHDTAPLGLLVDAAVGLAEVPFDALRQPAGEEPNGLVTAVTAAGLLLLDADALLRDPRLFTTAQPTLEEMN